MSPRTLKSIGEFGLIERIRKSAPLSKNIVAGIGDDAAVLKSGKQFQLLCTDMLVEKVDFTFKTATPYEVGRKALAVNLSDIAAMGGTPEAALVALACPQNTKLKAIDGFYSGIKDLAKKFGISLIGGDLSKASSWMVTVTIIGKSDKKPILRSGARAGDLVCVTGTLGGSILGKHLCFTPRVEEGKFIAKAGASSMIDVSDGLLQDLSHLLKESKVSADIDLGEVPVSKDAVRLFRRSKQKPIQHAVSDGEDFELLFTISLAKFTKVLNFWSKRFKIPLSVIGKIKSGNSGVDFWHKNRKIKFSTKKAGFKHF